MSSTLRPVTAVRALKNEYGIKLQISVRDDNYFVVWFLFGLLFVAIIVIPSISHLIDIYKIGKLKRCKQLRKERMEREAEEARQLTISKDQRFVLPPNNRMAYYGQMTAVNVPPPRRGSIQQMQKTRFMHDEASLELQTQTP
ncbi:unnamed protein product [Dimorphilus gyrociliatus]|uniref:Uncharacterized protein n=1 Tax=Dimorphilus gyrociliatus TaxID=2664684 RepID=A0A7I8V601_9ANNE|nr:unnamed protein product [Dimorphilus gyrociliatus]